MNDEQKKENKPTEVRIHKNGPIIIKGIFRFRESSGKITEGVQELYLCGCGESSSKPWCDRSHTTCSKPD